MNPYAASDYDESDDSSRRHAMRSELNLLELLIVVVVISCIVALLWPTIGVHPLGSVDAQVRMRLTKINEALVRCQVNTGSAPATVDDLKQLAGEYLEVSPDPEDLLTKMVMTGKDYWGNRLQIEPDESDPGSYILRCLGPDGVIGTDAESDDIVVRYHAGDPVEASDEDAPLVSERNAGSSISTPDIPK